MPVIRQALFVVGNIMPTSAEHRQERIKYLRKQEDRKRRLPDLLNFLTDISGRLISESDVVSIEESESVWTKIRSSKLLQQANFSVSFPYQDKAKLTTVFAALQSSLSRQKQFFTTSRYQDTCILHIDTAFCVDDYDKIIKFDGDTFYIYDTEIKNGLWMDANEEHWADKEEYLWTYELKVRGLDWIDKVHKVYKQVQQLK